MTLQPHTDMSLQPPEWSSRQPLGYLALPALTLPAQNSFELRQHHAISNSCDSHSPSRVSGPQQHTSDTSALAASSGLACIPQHHRLPICLDSFRAVPCHLLETSDSTSQLSDYSSAASAIQRNLVGEALATAGPVAGNLTTPSDISSRGCNKRCAPHSFSSLFQDYLPPGHNNLLMTAEMTSLAGGGAEPDSPTTGSLEEASSDMHMDAACENLTEEAASGMQQPLCFLGLCYALLNEITGWAPVYKLSHI